MTFIFKHVITKFSVWNADGKQNYHWQHINKWLPSNKILFKNPDKFIITLSIYFWNLHADQTIKDYRKNLWSLANLICLWFADRKIKEAYKWQRLGRGELLLLKSRFANFIFQDHSALDGYIKWSRNVSRKACKHYVFNFATLFILTFLMLYLLITYNYWTVTQGELEWDTAFHVCSWWNYEKTQSQWVSLIDKLLKSTSFSTMSLEP